jgi:hypothetical protein
MQNPQHYIRIIVYQASFISKEERYLKMCFLYLSNNITSPFSSKRTIITKEGDAVNHVTWAQRKWKQQWIIQSTRARQRLCRIARYIGVCVGSGTDPLLFIVAVQLLMLVKEIKMQPVPLANLTSKGNLKGTSEIWCCKIITFFFLLEINDCGYKCSVIVIFNIFKAMNYKL